MRQGPSVTALISLGGLVGVLGGVCAILFHILIQIFIGLFYGATAPSTFIASVTELPWYVRVAIPALGGLIVGAVVILARIRGIAGEGVSEVIESIEERSGKIHPATAPFKMVISAISIGSGGAGGREGPIIQIGSSIGSTVARIWKLQAQHTMLLIGCGASAIISGTLGAPIAGVLFSIEILFKKVPSPTNILLLMFAASAGTIVASPFILAKKPLFSLPDTYTFNSIDTIFFACIGITGALVGILFAQTLFRTRELFKKIPIGQLFRPALGGLLLGFLSLFFVSIHEPASGTILRSIMHGELSVLILSIFICFKIVGTSLTLGSGGSGGVLMPSLLIGASLGSIFGAAGSFLGITPFVPAYTLIGMAAVFSAMSGAPLTAALLAIELTHSYMLTIPILIVSLLAVFVARRITQKNVYDLLKKHDD